MALLDEPIKNVPVVKNYINGEWVESKGELVDVINPANCKVIAKVPISSKEEMEEAIAAAEDVCKRTFLFGSLATLKYIAMSGRVGYLAAGLAAMMDIKPILSLSEGKLSMLEKIRTQRKSWKRVVELSKEKVGGKKIESMAIQHVNALDSAREFEQMLRAELACPSEILITDMTPGLSCHTGAGTVAVICVTAK